jgi:hypothetical protein
LKDRRWNPGKHYLENFSYLPTTIMNMVNGTPEYAQWNYRISCHPLKHDLPLGALKPVDDMAARIGHRWNITRFAHTRAARFTLAVDTNTHRNHYHWENGYGDFSDRIYTQGLLDKIMGEIPGKDNYPGVLHDSTFGWNSIRIFHSFCFAYLFVCMGVFLAVINFHLGNVWT